MNGAPNREIVEDLRAGRRSGVVRLVRRYQRRLVAEAVAVFRVPQPDAEEIVDDVLLTVVQQIGGFAFRRGDGDFHAWVITVFRNRVRDFMRRSAMLGEIILSFDEAGLGGDEADGEEGRDVLREIVRGYGEELLRTDAGEPDSPAAGALAVVHDVLDEMESWERVLLRCRALDVPYEEIARYTGKKAENLRVYHDRVRKKFTGLLQQRLQGVA